MELKPQTATIRWTVGTASILPIAKSQSAVYGAELRASGLTVTRIFPGESKVATKPVPFVRLTNAQVSELRAAKLNDRSTSLVVTLGKRGRKARVGQSISSFLAPAHKAAPRKASAKVAPDATPAE